MKALYIMIVMAMSLLAADPIVSSKWLNEHLKDENIRIVEVSDGDLYPMQHIPTAAHTSIGKWRSNNGTYLEIRSDKEIQDEIRALGIDDKTHVVLYAPINTPKDLLKTSYVYWALNYYGIETVSLLDGGLNQWIKEGYTVTADVPEVKPSSYTVSAKPSKIADITYVKAHIGKLPMIDARPADKYLGITPTDTVKRDGHIKGAMSYSWNYSVDGDYLLKSKEALDDLFEKGYNLKKDEEVIVYCTGGLETSFNYFVLSGVLGYENVRLYDASMKEWGNKEDTPMEKYRYEVFGY